jgi:hypothetical protein
MLGKILPMLTIWPFRAHRRPQHRRYNRQTNNAGAKGQVPGSISRARHQFFSQGTPLRNRRPTFRCRPGGQIIAYHGTPSTANARSILRDGWKVGSGNSAGDGVYFARDLATARIYAGNGGVYLKCRILLGRSCRWDGRMESIFKKWCDARGATRDGSAKTAFLRHQGYDTLTDGKVVVILQPQYANPEAWKKKDRRIRILGVYRASDGRRTRV